MSTHETPTREREVIDNYRKALRAVLADKDLPEIDRGIQYLHDLVVITVKNLRPSPARQNMLERIVGLGVDMVKAAEQGRSRPGNPTTQFLCGNQREFLGGIQTCTLMEFHDGVHQSFYPESGLPWYEWPNE